jgi:hypothetical protein
MKTGFALAPIEPGFSSHPTEGKKTQDVCAAYRRQMAKAIVEGTGAYQAIVERPLKAKSEIRIPETRKKAELRRANWALGAVWEKCVKTARWNGPIRASDFFRVSDFEIRISGQTHGPRSR